MLLPLAALMLWSGAARANDPLDYQKRAQRYEGIKPKPVSGFDIELLSAQIDFQDNPETLGDRFQVRFFLDQVVPVQIIVRELDYKHYYWLDKIEPSSPWSSGFGNVFAWPTADVVQQLGDLRISDLGVVARLGRNQPSSTERVAPVLLYQSQFPSEAQGYVFTFRLREDARIKGAVYNLQERGRAVYERDLGRQRGGRPFAFKWKPLAGQAAEGRYKVIITGYALDTNDPVHQEVEFHHRPAIK